MATEPPQETRTVEELWSDYGDADRAMALLASRTDEQGMDLHTMARDRAFAARNALEQMGAWK